MAAAVKVSTLSSTIQNIKEIAGNHTDEEVYAALRNCNMDPNETAQKLLHQDTFHEVKRKRDKKRESNKESADPRWRPGTRGRGGEGGRGNYSARQSSKSSDSTGRNANAGKENDLNMNMDKCSSSSATNSRSQQPCGSQKAVPNKEWKRHVIIPDHLQVTGLEKYGPFGSFELTASFTDDHENGMSYMPPEYESSQEVEEVVEEPASSYQGSYCTVEAAAEPGQQHLTAEMRDTISSQEDSIQNTCPAYALAPPSQGNPIPILETSEYQVQQTNDFTADYNTYRPITDADGHLSPFTDPGTAAKSGNMSVPPTQTGQTQEQMNSMALSLSRPTSLAAPVPGVVPSSISRQPFGVHVPHYQPGFSPYNQCTNNNVVLSETSAENDDSPNVPIASASRAPAPSSAGEAVTDLKSASAVRIELTEQPNVQFLRLRNVADGMYLHAADDACVVRLDACAVSHNAVWALQECYLTDDHGTAKSYHLFRGAYGRYLGKPDTSSSYFWCRKVVATQRDYNEPEDRSIMWQVGSHKDKAAITLNCAATGHYLESVSKRGTSYMRLLWQVEIVPSIAKPRNRTPAKSIWENLLAVLHWRWSIEREVNWVLVDSSGNIDEGNWGKFTLIDDDRSDLDKKLSQMVALPTTICIRAGSYGQPTPLCVNLPRSNEKLHIILYLNGTPGCSGLSYPDVDHQVHEPERNEV